MGVLNQVHDPFLCFHIRFDVALGGGECSMSSEHLNVSQDPPTVEIVRAALVMKVRRPEWLEQPLRPVIRYH